MLTICFHKDRIRACDDEMPQGHGDLAPEFSSARVNLLVEPALPDYATYRYIENQDFVEYVDFKGYGVFRSLDDYLACLTRAKCDLYVFMYANRLVRSDMELIRRITEQLKRPVFVAKSFLDLAACTNPKLGPADGSAVILEAKRLAELEKRQKVFADLFDEETLKLDSFKIFSISCLNNLVHQLDPDFTELLESIGDILPPVSAPSNQMTVSLTKSALTGLPAAIAEFRASDKADRGDLLQVVKQCRATLAEVSQPYEPSLYSSTICSILQIIESKLARPAR